MGGNMLALVSDYDVAEWRGAIASRAASTAAQGKRTPAPRNRINTISRCIRNSVTVSGLRAREGGRLSTGRLPL
jgi:hypothetical protein